MIATLKAAKEIAGTLGHPSKMPGHSYGLPAAACITGSKLRGVKGTPCENCYAYKRGNYRFTSVQVSQERRLDGIEHPQWVDAMVLLIDRAVMKSGEPFFRWHDSGDLQGLQHLTDICTVADRLPHVRFWLPTQERLLIKLLDRPLPANLIIRLSGAKVDGRPPNAWPHTSTVHTNDHQGHLCPAPTQGNNCGTCRACWDDTVSNVSYHIH